MVEGERKKFQGKQLLPYFPRLCKIF